jgi:D-lactate dehydrogenase (cytochrome)
MIRKNDPQMLAPYLRDASGFLGGKASEVIIPETVEELSEFLKTNRQSITIAGAGTGVTAGRIPSDGIIISLERFKQIGEINESSIEVGAAVTLHDLQEYLQGSLYFYPPNPTETWASIGGTLATNASGARSYKFGATRDYVLEAEIVLSSGQIVRLPRKSKITDPLEFGDGSRLHFPSVSYQSPDCKNAAGYYVRPGMDWLDAFIGSEGTLGIITSCRLKLLPRPAGFVSGVLFFKAEESCWDLVRKFQNMSDDKISPCSLEYFDKNSLNLLRSKHPLIPAQSQAGLFFEQDVARDYDSCLEQWFDFLTEAGVSLDDSWFAQNQKDLQRFQEFRHDLPQILNEENSRLGRVKIGTDMAVSDVHFEEMMRYYSDTLTLSGVDYVMFGHIGDNHLHVNLLPRKDQEKRAGEIYQSLVDQILKWRGTVSAEHGIGKLKKKYFVQMAGQGALAELKQIKRTLDPNWLLGVGNTFDP